MIETMRAAVYRLMAILIIISVFIITCSLITGPLYLMWNYSFGLFIGIISYESMMGLVMLASVLSGIIMNIIKRGKNG
tara:strand:+ start:938 stop:1171 length:234 start_codon:yes stop_codon:yes gene_type:complete